MRLCGMYVQPVWVTVQYCMDVGVRAAFGEVKFRISGGGGPPTLRASIGENVLCEEKIDFFYHNRRED